MAETRKEKESIRLDRKRKRKGRITNVRDMWHDYMFPGG